MIVRPPRESEWPACRMLLPSAFEAPGRPEFLLALGEESPRIAGAAAYRRYDAMAHSVQMHVLPAFRRQSIGSLLLGRLIEEARRAGDREIAALVDLERVPEAGHFLSARGFTRRESLISVETGLEAMLEGLRPLTERLRRAGRIPDGVAVVPLEETHAADVIRLYADYIVRNPDLHPQLLRAAFDAEHFKHSQVLTAAGKVEGVLLIEFGDPTSDVPACVVKPEYRHGWAAALLLEAGVAHALALGGRLARFDFLDTNRNMVLLARRFETTVVSTRARFVHALSAPPQEARSEQYTAEQ